MQTNSFIVLAALLAVVAVGCSRRRPTPKTLAECKAFAAGARDGAAAARQAAKPADAARSAQYALECSNLAEKMLAESAQASEADKASCAETLQAAREAGHYADLAREDALLTKLASSWKARVYRGARRMAMKAAVKALAAAARRAGQADSESIPEEVRQAADAAAELAGILADTQPASGPEPNWDAVARDMDTLAAGDSAKVGLCTAVGLMLSGRMKLSLYEIESVDPTAFESDPDTQTCYHLVRGASLSMNGLPALAAEQLEETAAVSGDSQWTGPELLGILHLMIAASHLQSRRFVEADKALVRSMQCWPDNPVGVFLTGETLAANGQYVQAAESLEQSAAGTQDEWLAKRLAARARKVRDQRGQVEPLFCDAGFLCEALTHTAARAGREKLAEKLGSFADSARQLGKQWLSHLQPPGTGDHPGSPAGSAAIEPP